MPADLAALRHRLEAGTPRVGVLGLGAVGLPLVELLVEGGCAVVGVDTEPDRIEALTAGRSPVRHVSDEALQRCLASGRLTLAGNPAGDSPLDAALICVPTPLDGDGQPDLSAVRAAARGCAPALARPGLVVLESTTWPGTTREVLGEELAACGSGALLAFSPERVDPGRKVPPMRAIPKLVGGTCADSGDLAAALYARAFSDVRIVSSAEVAEAAKLTENVFRAVNIALANELAEVHRALGLDPHEVVEAAATKPFGFQRFDPGPGVGGHCIPVDPVYLAWIARRVGAPVPLVERALAANAQRPAQVAAELEAALQARGGRLEGARVLLVGIAYKPDTESVASAPALDLARALAERGALLEYCDPHVPRPPRWARALLGEESVSLDAERLSAQDAAILITPHEALDLDLLCGTETLVLDPRGALRGRR